MRELYILALYATRPVEQTEGSDDHEVSLRVALVVASGDDEARRRAMARLLELCPRDEGWSNHYVTLNTVTKEQLQSVYETIMNDAPGKDTDSLEWPELII